MGLTTWAKELSVEGRPFSFARFPWLASIYNDDHPEIVVPKGSQLGFSIWALLRGFHGLLTRYRGVIYFMPTKDDVSAFVKGRIDPMIIDNPAMRKNVRNTSNVDLKRISNGTIYFRGMNSRSGLKSVPADLLIFDELDEVPAVNVRLAEKRLFGSSFRHRIEISNPTLPDKGIDKRYQESDRMIWHLRCYACGKWEAPDLHFPMKAGKEVPCIREQTDGPALLVCSRCGEELTDLQRGKWIPMNIGRGRCRGYRLSQLARPGVDLDAILHEYRTTEHLGEFYNGVIGVAYLDATDYVSRTQVLQLCGVDQMAEHSVPACSMGIDVGGSPATGSGIMHYVISTPDRTGARRRRYVRMGIVATMSDLDDLIRRFHVNEFVIDAMPETDLVVKWIASTWPGRGWRCYYDENRRQGPAWNEKERSVAIHRTQALDSSREAIRRQEITLPASSEMVKLFAQHQEHAVKKLVTDARGNKRYVYVKRTVEDHFAHSLTYDAMLWRKASTAGVARVRVERDRDDVDILSVRY